VKYLEVVYEDLARSNTVTHLFQLSYGFSPSSHMGFCGVAYAFPVIVAASEDCHIDAAWSAGCPALIGLFSTCLSVYLLLFYRSDWLANPIACASFPAEPSLFYI
jgi:hypothetical protein